MQPPTHCDGLAVTTLSLAAQRGLTDGRGLGGVPVGAHSKRDEEGEAMPNLRQKILILYLTNSALDSPVIGWALYDGTGRERHTTGDSEQPPYATGLEALRAGWRAIQFSQLTPPYPGTEFSTSFYKYEVIFEQLEERHE